MIAPLLKVGDRVQSTFEAGGIGEVTKVDGEWITVKWGKGWPSKSTVKDWSLHKLLPAKSA
jgi:hypothetical protein